MHKDRYGLACTGSAVAVQCLARAQEHLLRFRPEVVEELDAAIAEDADCMMARAARAWIGLMSSEWPDTRAVYDRLLHHAASLGIPLEMLDASGLLWRLSLDGVDTGGRWAALADAWAAKDPTPWYVFNDLQAIMAFVGAGRQAQAEQRVAEIERYLRESDPGHANHRMVAGAGLAAARALAAWGRGDDDAAVVALAPVRHHLPVFGGSHAQRDAYQRTLLCAALRGGHGTLARQLLDERLAAKPGSPWNRMRNRQWRGLNSPAA